LKYPLRNGFALLGAWLLHWLDVRLAFDDQSVTVNGEETMACIVFTCTSLNHRLKQQRRDAAAG